MANKILRKGVRTAVEVIKDPRARLEYIDACIASLTKALATEPSQVNQECLDELKCLKNEITGLYGLLYNIGRK
jgi:hypothetical protein